MSIIKNREDFSNCMFLEVGGYLIKINLKGTKGNHFVRKKLEEFYFDFFINKPKKRPKLFLDVQDMKKVLFKRENSLISVPIAKETNREKKIIVFSHSSIYHFTYLISRYLNKIMKDKGVFIHSSASLIKNKIFLFLGKSGEGKSTLVSMLSPRYPIYVDDVSLLKKEKSSFFVYQTINFEKVKLKKSSKGYELEKVFFIKKSENFFFEKIKNKTKVIKQLKNQILMDDEETENDKIRFLINFVSLFDHFYFLCFKKNPIELEKFLFLV